MAADIELSLETVEGLFEVLKARPGKRSETKVRERAAEVFREAQRSHSSSFFSERKRRLRHWHQVGEYLTEFIEPAKPEAYVISLFRSGLAHECVPELRHLRPEGEAHTIEALLQLKRLKQRPQSAGELKSLVKAVTKKEWQILAFAALYSEIAKERAEIVRPELENLGKDELFVREVLALLFDQGAGGAGEGRRGQIRAVFEFGSSETDGPKV